jgi:hypothetical protein
METVLKWTGGVVGGVIAAVLAVTVTLIVIAVFPPVLAVVFAGIAVALAWWGIGGLRRGTKRFLSIVALCLAPVMLVAALATVFAFAPIDHSNGPAHSSPVTVEHS